MAEDEDEDERTRLGKRVVALRMLLNPSAQPWENLNLSDREIARQLGVDLWAKESNRP